MVGAAGDIGLDHASQHQQAQQAQSDQPQVLPVIGKPILRGGGEAGRFHLRRRQVNIGRDLDPVRGGSVSRSQAVAACGVPCS